MAQKLCRDEGHLMEGEGIRKVLASAMLPRWGGELHASARNMSVSARLKRTFSDRYDVAGENGQSSQRLRVDDNDNGSDAGRVMRRRDCSPPQARSAGQTRCGVWMCVWKGYKKSAPSS